jgi:hypothetical protein
MAFSSTSPPNPTRSRQTNRPPTTAPERTMIFATSNALRGGLLRLAAVSAQLTSPASAMTRSFTSVPNTLSSRLPVPRILGATTLLQQQQQPQVRGMKVRASVKKLCDGCMVCLEWRNGILPGISRRKEEALLRVSRRYLLVRTFGSYFLSHCCSPMCV